MLEQSTLVTNCLEDSASCELFDFLIDVLRKELAIYGELRHFLQNEKKMIMKVVPLQEMSENNALKENLILKARILEEGRMNVLKKIARNLDINDEPVKLISLSNHAQAEQRQALLDLKMELSAIAKDIKKMNEENRYLLDISVNNIKGSLEFISSLVNRSGVYHGNGKIGEVNPNGSLLKAEG